MLQEAFEQPDPGLPFYFHNCTPPELSIGIIFAYTAIITFHMGKSTAVKIHIDHQRRVY
jgi:hypothetical protein